MSSSMKKHRNSGSHRSSSWLGVLSIAGLALGLGGCTDPLAPEPVGEFRAVSQEPQIENNDFLVPVDVEWLDEWAPYGRYQLFD